MADPCDQIKKDMKNVNASIQQLMKALKNAKSQQEKDDIQEAVVVTAPAAADLVVGD